MDDWLSGAISGGAGLIGSAVNYFSQQSANETNLQLARENRDFYYQQWQRENQYNDPSAVMQRLSRAGLNPNLMYGEGTGGLAASATMQNVDPGRVAAPTVDPYLMAQIGLMNAQTEKTEKETEKTESDIRVNEGIIKVNDSVVLYNRALTNMTKYQQDNIVAQTKLLGSQVDEINSKIALNKATIESMTEETKIKWVETNLRKQEVEALVEKYAAETGFTKEQLKYYAAYIGAQIADLRQSFVLKDAQAALTREQAEEVRQHANLLRVTRDGLSFQNSLDQDYGATMREMELARYGASIIEIFDGSLANKLSGGMYAGKKILEVDKKGFLGKYLK